MPSQKYIVGILRIPSHHQTLIHQKAIELQKLFIVYCISNTFPQLYFLLILSAKHDLKHKYVFRMQISA